MREKESETEKEEKAQKEKVQKVQLSFESSGDRYFIDIKGPIASRDVHVYRNGEKVGNIRRMKIDMEVGELVEIALEMEPNSSDDTPPLERKVLSFT